MISQLPARPSGSGLQAGARPGHQRPIPAQADLCLLIQQALAHRRVLRFQYQGAGKVGTADRSVEPLVLIHYLERWHLIAWCRARQGYRDFRTDRMSDVAVLPETFAPRGDFSISEYTRAVMPAADLRARVKFAPLSAERAKREWWLGVVDKRRAKEVVVLTLATHEWQRMVGWLLSFGRTATVLAPAELRELLVQAGEEAAAHHRGK